MQAHTHAKLIINGAKARKPEKIFLSFIPDLSNESLYIL